MANDLAGLLVASTIAAHKANGSEELGWLIHAEDWLSRGARVFCAVQTGHGHDRNFDALYLRMVALRQAFPGQVSLWTYSIDQGEDEVTSDNRLIAICTGRNLAHEVAIRDKTCEAILFLDTDVRPPEDLPERLLEIERPLVGGNVPAYCLNGPPVIWEPITTEGWSGPGHAICGDEIRFNTHPPFPQGADVREHWNTAGCLLVRRMVFTSIAWRWNPDAGLTDDPAFQTAAHAAGFGWTWTRHDVTVWHESLVPLEQRGRDRSVIRTHRSNP
jgi:hypothetical protein